MRFFFIICCSTAFSCGDDAGSKETKTPPPADCYSEQPPPQTPLPTTRAESQSWDESTTLIIETLNCPVGRWFTWLSFGSAWVETRASDELCEIWLGGETENPLYDGGPTQYCQDMR